MRTQSCLIFLSLMLGKNSFAQSTIFLRLGHQKVISAQNVTRVSIGDPNIVDVNVLNNSEEIILTSMRKGSTSLVVWKNNGTRLKYILKVGKKSASEPLSRKLKELEKIKTLYVQKSAGQYLIKGKIYKIKHLSLLEALKQKYNNIVDMSHFDSQALEKIKLILQTKIHQYHYSHIFVQLSGKHFKLSGYVSNNKEKQRVILLAKNLYPLIHDQIDIYQSQKPSIFIDVKFLEIHNSLAKNLGIQWPDQISASAGFSSSNAFSQRTISGNGIDFLINALSENGKARVLSNPKMMCRDGFTSSFLAGGEIPIRLLSERVANVIFKPYGVALKVKPHIHSMNNINLDLKIKISDLDSSVSIEGIPGIIEHHLQTSAQTKLNKPIVLGGFLQDRMRKNIKRLPILGTVPILGELFKSRSFQKKQSQFYIILTAYAGKKRLPLHKKFLKQPNTLNVKTKEYTFSLFD